MYIVRIYGKLHSAWKTRRGADNQKKVLKESGYRIITVKYDATVSCEDGYYYIH